MILPTSYTSALILLIFSFICLGSWAAAFKLAGPRWRFELFYFDFAAGALLFAVAAAFTFGTMGTELAFSDRLLVAGRSAQAYTLAAGFILNLGNMLLLAAVSLLGLAGAFPLAIGVAVIVSSFFEFRTSNLTVMTGGVVLMLLAVSFDGTASRIRDKAKKAIKADAPPPKSPPKGAPTRPPRKAERSVKGILVGSLAGIFMGFFYPIASRGIRGEFGVGPYAGLLLLTVGALLSTILFNFYFLNIAIDGGPLGLSAYFHGKARQHFLGFAGGAVWAAGLLSAALAYATPTQSAAQTYLGLLLPIASALLAVTLGALVWKEFAQAPGKAKLFLTVAGVMFAASLGLLTAGILS